MPFKRHDFLTTLFAEFMMLVLFDFAFEIIEKFSFSFGTVVNRISNFLKETISPGARCCRI